MYGIVKISDSTTVASPQYGISQRCAVQVWAVIDILVARRKREKHPQTTLHCLQSTEAPLVTGWKKTSSETGKGGCHTCLPQSVLWQLSVKFCSVFMSLFVRLNASQSDNWHSVFQSAKYMLSHIIRDFGYSKVCAKWVPQSLTVQHKT